MDILSNSDSIKRVLKHSKIRAAYSAIVYILPFRGLSTKDAFCLVVDLITISAQAQVPALHKDDRRPFVYAKLAKTDIFSILSPFSLFLS